MKYLRKYEGTKDRIRHWTKQYRETGSFPDGRGKGNKGRPKKTNTSTMTKDEYIKYYNSERPQWGLKKMTLLEFRCHLC